VWTLPPGDDDFSNRWKAIKIRFVQAIPRTERRSKVRVAKGERAIWQRRFWEHAIRDETDYTKHIDYVHWNQMKHGLVRKVADWHFLCSIAMPAPAYCLSTLGGGGKLRFRRTRVVTLDTRSSRTLPQQGNGPMTEYRRAHVPGATWCFTVNLPSAGEIGY
jgi:hypothetical protein